MKNTPMENCKDPFADKVKCDECKHWVDKVDASKVDVNTFGYWQEVFYCPMHKKPFIRKENYTGRPHFYGEVEMTEDGIPIGYVASIKKNGL